MRYLALATDYDGTLALNGRVDARTVLALEQLRESGRKLILVTGRELDELSEIFPSMHLFDWVVAENGALLYQPSTRAEKPLATPPPPAFVEELKRRGVERISCGRVIVATWEPHESTVLAVIRDMALELEIIFNKGAVMILPTGVNKATGLVAALDQLGLSPHNVVGVGDAENDHAFLSICECSVAVANALDVLKKRADVVTRADHGAGIVEIADQLLQDDLHALTYDRLPRHLVLLGKSPEGAEVRLQPHGSNVLVAGGSRSGKSTAVTGFFERLMEGGRQLVVVDPEGDFEALEGALVVGSTQHAPTVAEVLDLVAELRHNVVVNLVGLPLDDRPAFFLALLPRLQELRTRTGRPHWIAVDEAHHVLPVLWEPASLALPAKLAGMVFITVHPGELAPAALQSVDTILAAGQDPGATIAEWLRAIGEPVPQTPPTQLEHGDVLLYSRREGGAPARVTPIPGRTVRRRHLRKYAEGDLGAESFYFKGPENKLNLQAQNLVLFMQIANGVDDETWLYHLRRGEYSRWFRDMIKDSALAGEAEQIEADRDLTPAGSRAAIRDAIQRHYTLPAATPASAVAHVLPQQAK